MGYFCANFSFPKPLCSRVRPDVRDRRQTDRRQTKASLNASTIWGGGIIIDRRDTPRGGLLIIVQDKTMPITGTSWVHCSVQKKAMAIPFMGSTLHNLLLWRPWNYHHPSLEPSNGLKSSPLCSVGRDVPNTSITRICAAEMAVRYAALCACRKVRMPSVRAVKYMCVIVIR